MASASKTPNLNLPQWVGTEKPERTDFNAAMGIIDAIANTSLKNESGWFKDSTTGLIVQWGVVIFPSGTNAHTFSYPIAFPNACLKLVCCPKYNSNVPSLTAMYVVNSEGVNSASVYGRNYDNTYLTADGKFHYIAIGY